MSDVVIRAEGVGKKYLIGHRAERERYTTLRDIVARTSKGFARSTRDFLRGRQLAGGDEVEEFWALKGVSFEIKRGEVSGIVGHNGAGKSTLLKILSRITEPTEGRVEIRGRVASLLEVGTGFHPELTGRENIFLNGAILGMSRAEINRKFNEIVAFAEVARFLDVPVKRYSSGMYVRLAFAVAAHIEPDILVIDEVLAVGDADFQKKCLGKMGEVAHQGRTVLFVSHNISAIRALCKTAMLMNKGRLKLRGTTSEIISAYARGRDSETTFVRNPTVSSTLFISRGSITYAGGFDGTAARLILRLSVVADSATRASIDLRIKDNFGSSVAFASVGGLDPLRVVCFSKGVNDLIVYIDAGPLAKGRYSIGIDLADPNIRYYDRVEDCLSFSIDPVATDGATRLLDQQWGYGSILLSSAGDCHRSIP